MDALLAAVFCSSLSESGRYSTKSTRYVQGNTVLPLFFCTCETYTEVYHQVVMDAESGNEIAIH